MHSIDAIRKRPGMYVGDTHDGSGRLQLLWELLANAFDEHLSGECDEIRVEIDAEGAFIVEDNGRGLRVDEVDGLPFAQIALTRFHDAPTLDGHAPHEHFGPRGVGLFPVCVLSQHLSLRVFREGREYAQAYARGQPLSPLADVGPTSRRGTRVRALPDPEIFGDLPIETDAITTRLHELSCLFPELTLYFVDRRERRFHAPDGLSGMLRIALRTEGLNLEEAPFTCAGLVDGIRIEAVATWTSRDDTKVESFANVCPTTDGGTHVSGLLHGLVQGARQSASLPSAENPAIDIERAVVQGLRAVVCVRLADPAYARPTRDRLATPEVSEAVAKCVAPAFAAWLDRDEAVRTRIAAALD